jgi:membrane-associated phospholipid phosphatase
MIPPFWPVKPSGLSEKAERLLDADAALATAAKPLTRTPAMALIDRIADLGDQPAIRILCGTILATGIAARDPRLARTGVRMLAAHTLATVAKDFVKKRVDRTRPRSLNAPGKIPRPSPGRKESKEETSFPSGHSAGAAAAARAFSRDYPEYAGAALGIGALLALAQIPRRAHYPTDVGAGIVLGLAAETVASLAFRAVGLAED